MEYYNEIRTHLSLDKDAPVPRAVGTVGHIFVVRSWAGCIISMSGSDLRQAQVPTLRLVSQFKQGRARVGWPYHLEGRVRTSALVPRIDAASRARQATITSTYRLDVPA
jgi:hypothetical protein